MDLHVTHPATGQTTAYTAAELKARARALAKGHGKLTTYFLTVRADGLAELCINYVSPDGWGGFNSAPLTAHAGPAGATVRAV